MRPIIRKVASLARRGRLIAPQKERRAIASGESKASDAAEDIAKLRSTIESLRRKQGRVKRPSFYFKHHEMRRVGKLLGKHGAIDPIWSINPKHAAYEFAREHGVRVPEVLHHYSSAESIEWDILPAEFVLKTVKGTGSRGVIPLVRSGDKFRDLLGSDELMSIEDLKAMLKRRLEAGEASDEMFAEELLRAPYPGHEDGLALDVKLYCFYGVVGMLMVRNGNGTRAADEIRARYFDPEGNDLGDAVQHLELDPSLPAPLFRKELVDAAQRLSSALPRPFVRLDFYEQPDGVVFGEVTPSPGGQQLARRDIDEKLGSLWEDAEARLLAESIKTHALDRRPDARPVQLAHLM